MRKTASLGAIRRLPGPTQDVVRIALYGLGGGVAAVLFQVGISWLYRGTYVRLSHGTAGTFLLGTFAVALGTSLASGWLLAVFCREAAGSGIPQLKAAFWKDRGFIPWRVAWVKFVAGILSVGGGSSLGREGPSVQLGGAIGSTLAGGFGEPRSNRRLGAASGAAAGLAAAFNTPLAAVTFVLEEIVQDLNSRLLGGVLLASVLGAFVVHAVIGKHPSFALAPAAASGYTTHALVVVVAAVSAAVGIAFQRLTLRLRARTRGGCLAQVPAWLRPAIGACLAWLIGSAVYLQTGHLGVFSLGYDDLSAGLANALDWRLAGVLLAAKFAATVLCYGMGGCGGVFSPTLFLGGMCGLLLAGVATPLADLVPADHVLLGVVGMSACLGAVVRAPVTGILIVFEMTHNFTLVPALMVGAIVSQAVGRSLARHNFYDAVLEQDGVDVEHLRPPRDLNDWRQVPISSIATKHPVCLDGLDPAHVRERLDTYPYARFPVIESGHVAAVLSRFDAEAAAASRPVRLLPPVECAPDTPVGEVQRLLMSSRAGAVLVTDPTSGALLGLVTLHDVLRAEIGLAHEESTADAPPSHPC